MKTRKVVIVGGGSSGWMTAAYLNAALSHNKRAKVEITLIESPDIPRISVGEATVLSMRHLIATIGIDEVDFLKATDGSFKQAIKYVNWVEKDDSFYYHPFNRFTPKPLDLSSKLWLASDRTLSYTDTVTIQPHLCELGFAPKTLGEWNLGAPFSYAYHMNAQKFADLLTNIAVSRGVEHIKANMTDVNLREDGSIHSIETDQGHILTADLFIDCTGFRAKLIEEKLNVGFEDCSQWLLCNRAVTMHVPYDKFYPGYVRPYTTATALSNGWVWDIPMQNQRSIGYVHASDFISEEEALKELHAYQGEGCEELPARTIHFKVGRRHQTWFKNCISIGLSGGFIEPLESTGLYLADLGAVMLAEHFPYSDEDMSVLSQRYNRIMSNQFYEVLDFINMHYCLTKRTDTEFWREVQKPERINDRLKAKLEFWKAKPPTSADFEDQFFPGMSFQSINESNTGGDNRPSIDTSGIWNNKNYEFILYSMGFENHFNHHWQGSIPAQTPPAIQRRFDMARNSLAKHDEWLKKVVGMKEFSEAKKPVGWV
ncbi:tryptophan halogenase family protein [Pleionea sediminis]|uniref:tryptophan halogenase family protein n=1 Tax=Pleionea sediminis TaxID=2569479 RepID=UPI0011858DE3|nr:tryptophan halogenase family protein [Pleionea sediminis]